MNKEGTQSPAQLEPSIDKVDSLEQPGVAVDFETAVATMQALKELYGYYNKARGAEKASRNPALRAEMEKRIADVDEMVRAMGIKATNEFIAREIALYAPLAATEELRAVGFHERDIQSEEELGRIALRRRIGTTVTDPERRGFIRKTKRLVQKPPVKKLEP